MQVTLQLKLSMDKAEQLRKRLEELQHVARHRRATLEQKKAKDEKAYEELKLAREVELDMNLTNLLRAIVDHGLEHLLVAPNATLVALLHASKVRRGRPARKAVSK